MKAKLTILFLYVSVALFAQESITVSLDRSIQLSRIDSSGTKTELVQEKTDNRQITLVRPVYLYIDKGVKDIVGRISYNEEYYNYAATDNGYFVLDNNVRTAISRSDYEKYKAWFSSFKKQRKTEEKQAKTLITDSFDFKQIQMQASVKMMSKANTLHDYLTVFTGGLEINFSHLRLLDFLQNHMQMSEKTNEFENGYIVSKCVQRTSKGNPDNLTLKYRVKSESGYFFPQQVEITGTPRRVIELFITYWNTKIQFDDAKSGNEYTCYMLPDKITLSLDKTGKAKILIVNSQ